MKTMIEKSKNGAGNGKEYVPVLVEMLVLDEKDVITASIGEFDVPKDDIFD